jgi:cell division protein FtsQ
MVFGVCGVAVAGVIAIALSTDHRGDRLVSSLDNAIVQASAGLGFRLDNIRLEGASPQSSADILRAAGLAKGQPLFGVDLADVRKRVERVGWVKDARVIRMLPDSIVISVDERHLMAVWQDNGRIGVIDVGGVVATEANPASFAGLPLVIGDGANIAAADILPHVLSRPRLAERLDALVRVDGRRWDLRLKDGTIIQLPERDLDASGNNEEAALIRLDQLDQQSRVLDLGFSRIDLRDPQMVAVRPRAQAPAASVGANGAG